MFLTGSSNMQIVGLAKSGALPIGLMLTPATGYARHTGSFAAFACDTGCFAQPERYDTGRYLRWLSGIPNPKRCLFATAPDVVCDAAATLRRSLPVLPLIRALGLPAALVAQNGLTVETTPWDELDALFLGGDTAWKLGHEASALVAAARAWGKHCHMGRVNSLRRLQAAAIMGCHSADGTFLARGPDKNLPLMRRWLDVLRVQPHFDLWGQP